jgi:hypothetical protein
MRLRIAFMSGLVRNAMGLGVGTGGGECADGADGEAGENAAEDGHGWLLAVEANVTNRISERSKPG